MMVVFFEEKKTNLLVQKVFSKWKISVIISQNERDRHKNMQETIQYIDLSLIFSVG